MTCEIREIYPGPSDTVVLDCITTMFRPEKRLIQITISVVVHACIAVVTPSPRRWNDKYTDIITRRTRVRIYGNAGDSVTYNFVRASVGERILAVSRVPMDHHRMCFSKFACVTFLSVHRTFWYRRRRSRTNIKIIIIIKYYTAWMLR